MNAIEIKNLNKTYSDFKLENITLNLPTGCILGLIGENGAGKSTMIKLMMDTIERDSGTVHILGVDNQTPDFNQTKEAIGVVLDEAYFPEVLTPANVDKIMTHTYRNWDKARYAHYLEIFKLPSEKAFKDFSRGMKMKLAIAVALSHTPKLLILDEATSGLDPMVRDEILTIFNDFTRDESNSILITSHITSDLEKICDYIAFIHNGQLLFCEEKDRLLEEYAIVKVSEADFDAIPEHAVKSVRRGTYGIEALVCTSEISDIFPREHTTLENIILFLAKGEKSC